MTPSRPDLPPQRLDEEASSSPRGVSFDSRTLLQGEREILIRHGDQHYRLRHTQNDKLILTK